MKLERNDMSAMVLVENKAVERLHELGLSVDIVERVVRRADAEASTFTALDPPIMEGLTRWGRTSRFLREELVPRGWTYDNPRNWARTIHPSGEFAIVAATGDELTGMAGPGVLPTTKYRKGDATIKAVAANEQLAFDFGDLDLFRPAAERTPGVLLTWVLLFYSDDHEFRVELSLPDGIEDGRISSWAERIILPPFQRDELVTDDDNDDADHVVVEIFRR
ncbi:MAG: hypothetical protein JO345_33720 [Streptosporangiaceae bacterium]|nr:hypothetical protein [Streptosporangiaceae bacterium]